MFGYKSPTAHVLLHRVSQSLGLIRGCGDENDELPSYLQLKQFKHNQTLRSSTAMQLEIPLVSHIYQDHAAKSLNILPGCARNCSNFNQFSKMTFKLLMKKVKDNLSA